MSDNEFLVSVGDHKRVIFAKVLNETNRVTAAITMANTHTNRRLVAEKDVPELKINLNCTKYTYKFKNQKYKTIHKCLMYNFKNNQDRLTFMDNLVKYLVHRRFPNAKKPLQIFELVGKGGKDVRVLSSRKLQLNPQVTIVPKPKVYHRKRKRYIVASSHSRAQNISYKNVRNTSAKCKVPQTSSARVCSNVSHKKKNNCSLEAKQRRKSPVRLQQRANRDSFVQSRPVTRSVTAQLSLRSGKM